MPGQKRSLVVGQRFGRLVVAEAFYRDGEAWCRCACDCGGEKIARRSNIRRGAVKSCGCLRPNHGDAAGQKTPEYIAWKGMIARCSNPNEAEFHRYGGRGISVCAEWRGSYPQFLADMGRRPTPQHSLDRKDNDGPYAPWNCRWATKLEQVRNKSNNHRVQVDGESKTISELVESTGLRRGTLWSRLERGWDPAKAIAAPLRLVGLTVDGVHRTTQEWAALIGITPGAIHRRLSRGWSVARAVATPLLRHARTAA